MSRPSTRLGDARRAALARRVRRIRRSVAGLALATFTAAFLTIYVQLASGHDPALTANSKRRAAVATTRTAAGTSSAATASTGTSTSSSSSESESEATEASSPSSVTTSQS